MKINVAGFVEVYSVKDGIWTPIASFKNTVLYSGYDILGKVVGGDSDFTVNGMYIQYRNGAPSEPVIAKDRVPGYYTSLSSPEGVCRVKTVADPSYSATSSLYDYNKVSFTAITDGSTLAGASVQDGVSNFYSIALVAIPDLADQTKDVLFSAANIYAGAVFTPILKVANSQVGFKWEIKLED
jgi:hypothetical protein